MTATANDFGQTSAVEMRNKADAVQIGAPGIPFDYQYVKQTRMAGKPSQFEYFDKAGRNIAKVIEGFAPGSFVYSFTHYDEFSRPVRVSQPTYNTASIIYAATEYDNFGRTLTVTSPDGITNTKTAYSANGLSVTNTTANNNGKETTKTTTRYVTGEIESVVEDSLASKPTIEYFYDATGNLTKVTGVDGSNIITTYDSLGRKKTTQDPSKGTWSYKYNALGELTEQTNAKSQATKFYRDTVGRTVRRVSSTDTTVYQYQKALLQAECLAGSSTQTDCNGTGVGKSYEYELGRSIKVNHYLLKQGAIDRLETATTYDGVGRVFQQFDAAGNAQGIHYHYNNNGYMYKQEEARYSGTVKTGDNLIYMEIASMDAFGNATKVKQNNGTIVTDKVFAADTGTISSISAQSAGNILQNNSYTFDGKGNLLSRARGTLNTTSLPLYGESAHNIASESFGYDHLDRLTTIEGSEKVSYYDNGNIKEKKGLGFYCYANTKSHQVIGIGSAQGCTSAQYSYDQNGNMTAGRNGTTFTYSSFDKPTRIETGSDFTTFDYDTSRSRYKRVSKVGAVTTNTYYVGNVEYIYEGNTFKETRRYVPGAIVTEKTASNQQISYLLKDHLGSIDTVVNEQNEILDKVYFDVWGKKALYSQIRLDSGDPNPGGIVTGYPGCAIVKRFYWP